MHNTGSAAQAELAYQAERAAKIDEVDPTPDYIIERYRRCRLWRLFRKEFVFRRLGNIAGKEVLDFGCGEGQISTQLARLGAKVTAIDISPELIEIAERRAKLDGVSEQIEFVIGDITQSPLPKEKFDVAVCLAALHHVDLRSVAPHVLACVKPGGVVMMMEPTAFSPLLKKLREILPLEKDASPDERQLNRDDVNFLSQLVVNVELTFFDLFGRLARLFSNANRIDRGHPFTKATLVMLGGLDRLLLTICPALERLGGYVVIVGRKPIAETEGGRCLVRARAL